jgi:hypothetical protein
MSWTSGGASIVGSSHRKTDTPCQDAHLIVTANGSLIVAVSDGLGSAALSHIGAKHVCTSVIHSIERTFDMQRTRKLSLGGVRELIWRFTRAPKNPEQMLKEAFTEAHQRLAKLAAAEGNLLSAYACTLVVVVVMADSWHTLHIGDGAVVGVDEDGSVRTLSAPERGEFVNSVTPLTSTRYQRAYRYAEGHERLFGVAVFSDGIQNLCINYKTGAAFDGFFQPILSWFRGLPRDYDRTTAIAKLLDSAQIRQKSDDDLTLAIALRS